MATFLSKLFQRKPGPASERLDQAERAFTEKRYAESAALFRELADSGNFYAQLRLAQFTSAGRVCYRVSSMRCIGSAPQPSKVRCQRRRAWVKFT